jgi:tetratricopeptide (TPR) repeat protein
MEPLFAAVNHGCAAGMYKEAMYDIYLPRIRRGKEAYTVHELGAFGSDQVCLAHFFDIAWGQPAAGLTEADKALVLNWAGFGLRALGRLAEASQPMQAGMELSIKQSDFKGAAIDASNLSELLLTLGRVKEAVDYGQQAVDFADKSNDEFIRMAFRTTLADALHQSGDPDEAEKLFVHAEAMQQKRQPQYPYLYSLRGYRFCDLLLTRGKYAEVLERASKTLEWNKSFKRLLDIGLHNLSLARAHLQKIEVEGGTPPVPERSRRAKPTTDFSQVNHYFDTAVAGLRQAGAQEFLVRGLLFRAACFRLQGLYDQAQTDLDEALEIIELGSMKLYLVDYRLESGRLCQARGQAAEAQAHFQKAKDLISQTGYHRRDGEVDIQADKQVRAGRSR